MKGEGLFTKAVALIGLAITAVGTYDHIKNDNKRAILAGQAAGRVIAANQIRQNTTEEDDTDEDEEEHRGI